MRTGDGSWWVRLLWPVAVIVGGFAGGLYGMGVSFVREPYRSRGVLPPEYVSPEKSGPGGGGKGGALGLVSLTITAAALVVAIALFVVGLCSLYFAPLVWLVGLWVVSLLLGIALLVALAGVIVSLPRPRREGLPRAFTATVVNASALALALWAALGLVQAMRQ